MVADRRRITAPDEYPEPRGFAGAPVELLEFSETAVRYPRPSRLRRAISAKPAVVRGLERLGIESVDDLLEHVPAAHSDRQICEVAELTLGMEATIEATLLTISTRPTRRRGLKLTEAQLVDRSGPITAVWWNQPWLAKRLDSGDVLRIFGKMDERGLQVREYSVIARQSTTLTSEDPVVATDQGGIVGVYPATEGLRPQQIRDLVNELRGEEFNSVDPLPGRLAAADGLPGRIDALSAIHFPRDVADIALARHRLALEELLLQQIALAIRRQNRRAAGAAHPLEATGEVVGPWIESLPFALTRGQREAIETIDRDLARPAQMQRLLMGEVGSGKTVVALAAMLRAVENGSQAALMAPTETLAEQHFMTLDRMLPQIPLALVTGSTRASNRRDVLGRLSSGELPLVVGTHALIEPDVEFRALSVAVVDEQHRFGVRQRAALDKQGSGDQVPHVLHMTATPIPRTLALTGYGDLDLTAIHELPSGRRPVKTFVAPEGKRLGAYEFVRERLREGRQAFVVCALVSESEVLEARAATVEAERLSTTEFKDFRVGLIHGQMTSRDKAAAIERFCAGKWDVLVSTTVIEVGIDVPNAAVMIVEDAERYGISQLHQLRGRVGRGEHESFCILFGPASSTRLKALATETDGFKLAQIDLEVRGAGEELGTRQSGLPRYRIASLPGDNALLERAHQIATDLVARDPELSLPEHGLLRDAVEARYGADAYAIPA